MSEIKNASFRNELALVFLIALGAIVLEVGMTRIFSFKLYYYFTYLILGIALLGLGTGGVFVAIFPGLRSVDPHVLSARCLATAAFAVPAAYYLIALVQLNVSGSTIDATELAKLFLICTALFTPFLLVGIVLATVFGNRPDKIDQLYFSDLIGAGLGCGICIPLFLWLTPPGAVVATGILFAASALMISQPGQLASRAAALAASVGIVGLLAFSSLPDPITDYHKTMSPTKSSGMKILFSSWSSVFRVDVLEFPVRKDMYTLNHDGNVGSSLRPWDGDIESLTRFETNLRLKPFSVLGPEPEVLVIGSAGGQELQASLFFGAGHVTGIELNPVTVSLLENEFSDYTGRVAHHERVTLINAEGRSFIERSDKKYDLIWMVAPDSYAAMNAASSGAFVLSESYLYTVEMVEAILDHLKPGGVLCAQFGELHLLSRPNRTPRFLITVREAMRRRGIEDIAPHVISSHAPDLLPASTTLISNEPFTSEQIDRYKAALGNLEGAALFHPLDVKPKIPNPIYLSINLKPEGVIFWNETMYPLDLSPVYDDSPFFWHFTSFWDALTASKQDTGRTVDHESATGERTLMVLLAFVTCFALIFILLPTIKIRGVWQQIPYKLNTGLYFAALGLSFMFIEVCLIQKLTLFLGYPSYSLTVTLFSLLVFSGIGSLFSGRIGSSRNNAFRILMGALALLVLGLQFGIGPVMNLLWDAGLSVRIVFAVLLTAPVGLCLGCFMPIGIETVASLSHEHEREYVAWAWAVNGFFSVVASVLGTILSMTLGFRWVFFIALVVYAIGVYALSRTPDPAD